MSEAHKPHSELVEQVRRKLGAIVNRTEQSDVIDEWEREANGALDSLEEQLEALREARDALDVLVREVKIDEASLREQVQTLQAAVEEGWEWKGEAGRLKEQLEALQPAPFEYRKVFASHEEMVEWLGREEQVEALREERDALDALVREVKIDEGSLREQLESVTENVRMIRTIARNEGFGNIEGFATKALAVLESSPASEPEAS